MDLSKTKYCDSTGLSAILVANRLCKDTNGSFALCGLQPSVRKMIEIARILNPTIECIVRSHNADEAELLRNERAGTVLVGEEELASGMMRHVVHVLEK